MSQHFGLPLYYQDQTLADMEAALRREYLTTSGWIESAESKMAQKNGKPVPWFTYSAIQFLEKNISCTNSIFEYGSGASTLYWGDRVKTVVSVDHDPSFVEYLKGRAPSNVSMNLAEEGATVPGVLHEWVEKIPPFLDPERTEHTFRSGQINNSFEAYALKILEMPRAIFDVVIIDGMARHLSTWAALQYLKKDGLIVFDNSDRHCYQLAYNMLADHGYRRIDFWGMGPINPYEWCTSVFYEPTRFLGNHWFSGDVNTKESKEGTESIDKSKLGIIVIGFNRPYHLQAVLESLRQQGRIGNTHVWIDGTQGRGEYKDSNWKSVNIAKRYGVKEVKAISGHMGIEKLMIDALVHISAIYERVLVLEDDCFPLEGGIDEIDAELDQVSNDTRIFSVYGHHFGTEPSSTRDFSRFQGWGWAAHSRQIKRILPELQKLFLMNESSYLDHITDRMTPEIQRKLDRTAGRDVMNVLSKFYSWDSATSFITAAWGLEHRRTKTHCIVNTGITPGIGHFGSDEPGFRQPPFNMISLEEVWDRFDRSTLPCNYERESYGLESLDRKILEVLPKSPGFFVELGAYDGITQSNSILLEAAGWRGLLIEANPSSYARCVRARPNAIVEHAACVGFDFSEDLTTITDVGLMSMTAESQMEQKVREDWLSRGEYFSGYLRQDIEVPARTLTNLLDKNAIYQVDVLILDVEGAEISVLNGLDFHRHAPLYIVCEDAYKDDVHDYLKKYGYKRKSILLERKFTRDCLYTL